MQAAGVRRLVAMGGSHARVPGDPGSLGHRLTQPILLWRVAVGGGPPVVR